MVEIAWISTQKQDFYFLFQLDCFFMKIWFNLEFFLHESCINDGNMICLKLPTLWPLSEIVYMCSSLLHLAVESCDLSQAVVTSWENSPTSFHPKISPMNNLSKKQLSMSMCFWSVTLADQLSSQFLIFFWSAIRKLSETGRSFCPVFFENWPLSKI